MKTANYLRPMSGYVIAEWEDTRQDSDLFKILAVAKDETELKAGDLIEVTEVTPKSHPKSHDRINTPVFSDAFRLKKSDIIGVYVAMPEDQKMFKPFDIEEE